MPAAPSQPQAANRSVQQKAKDAPPAAAPHTTPAAPTVPPDEKKEAPPVPGPTAVDILSNAKRDIGKIDRDLRKSFPKLLEAAPDSMQSRLEKGIAAAGKPNAPRMEEIISPDGQRMTKVTGPDGSYCVRKAGAGATDGLDSIQNGVRAKTTNCPGSLSF